MSAAAIERARALLAEWGCNPNRAPVRVQRLAAVLDAHPGVEVALHIDDGHPRSAGRRIREATRQGWTYIGGSTWRHSPLVGLHGHTELWFVRPVTP